MGQLERGGLEQKRARGHLGPQYLSEEILASCVRKQVHYITLLDLLSLISLIMIWKHTMDILMWVLNLLLLFGSSIVTIWCCTSGSRGRLIWVYPAKGSPSGFWINPFSESAKQKTELGPSSYINSVCPLEVLHHLLCFSPSLPHLGSRPVNVALWLAFSSLSQCVLWNFKCIICTDLS